jgi:hypothetical protein
LVSTPTHPVVEKENAHVVVKRADGILLLNENALRLDGRVRRVSTRRFSRAAAAMKSSYSLLLQPVRLFPPPVTNMSMKVFGSL